MNRIHSACFALALTAFPAAIGQETSDPPAEERKPTAYLRAWIFNPSEAVRIEARAEAAEEAINLASSSGATAADSPLYTELPAARVEISLLEGEQVRLNEGLVLRDGSYYTLVAWPSGRGWQVKVFADTVSASSSPRALRALNFAQGRETLIDAAASGEFKVAADSVAEFKVAQRITDLRVKVLASDDGPPAQSTVEVDFSAVPSAYVVVRPDYRGRMRPRVMVGGPPAEGPTEEPPAGGVQ